MGSCMSTTHGTATQASAGERPVMGHRQRKREMKRQAMEALANEAKNDALLATAPGRMFRNGASDAASIFTQQGRKGTNQDAMLVWEGFASKEDTVFCGVFDGHGPFGHLVARRVRDSLPSKLVAHWLSTMRENIEFEAAPPNGAGEAEESIQREHREISAQAAPPASMFGPWKESHLTAYRVMDRDLCTHPVIDCFCSGTTAVTVLKQGQHLVIGNVGDSRAIMGTQDEHGAWRAVQLTVDLKPNLPQEAERIRECKGRVFALHDEPEVSRVWLPYDDSPGLAMARAFGDFCLKDYGVIAVPEITHRQVTDRDKFIVLATDGIWDVLSNAEAVQIVAKAPTRATAARALVESAVRVWRLKYPTSKVDDCAVVCLYFDPPAAITTAQTPPGAAEPPTDGDPNKEGANGDGVAPERAPTFLSKRKDPPTGVADPGEVADGEGPRGVERNGSRRQRSLADWLDGTEDEEWSALEGVTRVNSLLNLPRFLEGDRRAEGSPRRTT